VKLDPTPEEEEDSTTDVVLMVDKRKDSSVAVDVDEQVIDKVVVLNLDDDDEDYEDGASTLVGHDTTGMFGEKEIDMEVTDSEGEDEHHTGRDADQTENNGVKRKRTIRVIIRSRAFL
jgi:hypothetical protein